MLRMAEKIRGAKMAADLPFGQTITLVCSTSDSLANDTTKGVKETVNICLNVML